MAIKLHHIYIGLMFLFIGSALASTMILIARWETSILGEKIGSFISIAINLLIAYGFSFYIKTAKSQMSLMNSNEFEEVFNNQKEVENNGLSTIESPAIERHRKKRR